MSYNLGTASGRIEIDGKAGAAGFKAVEVAAGAMFGAVKNRVGEVEQLGRRLRNTGAAGLAGFGVAIKVAAGFEQQMSGVRAVTNATEDDFDALREKALQLGADTSFSASEAALAIEELAKAGIPIEDILNGAAEGAVALAAAGGIGLAQAAEISANAMNQFGLGADKVGEVADILAGVANTSAADVSSIGQSLSQAGAVANLAGLSFRDTAIAIGEMADAGINGSDAGTSLKTMLNNLIPTTKKQSNMFKELGLLTYDLEGANKALRKEGLGTARTLDEAKDKLAKYNAELDNGKIGTEKNAEAVDKMLSKYGGLNNAFFDSKGNIKDLAGLQGELGDALKGMTKEQKLASLETLFGADAMRATAILSLAGAEGYKEFSDAVSQTSAADVAAQRLDNLSGASEAFKGAMETALITVGSVFLPAVTAIVKGATAMVNVFNNLPSGVKTAIAVIVAIAAAISTLVGIMLASLTTIALFIAQFFALKLLRILTSTLLTFAKGAIAGSRGMLLLRASLASGGKAMRRFTLTTKIATVTTKIFVTTLRLLRAAFLFAFGPWGLLIAAIVIGFILLYKKSETFRNAVNNLGTAIKQGLVKAWQSLQPVLMKTWEIIKQVGEYFVSSILPVLKEVGKVLLNELGKAFMDIAATVKSDLLPALKSMADNFQGNILPAIKEVYETVGPFVKQLLKIAIVVGVVLFRAWVKWAQFLIGTVYPILIRIVGFLAGPMIGAIAQFAKGMIKAISGIVNYISGFIKIVKGIFTGDWSLVWEGAKQILQGFVQFFTGVFQAMFSGAISVIKRFGKTIINAFKDFFSGIFGSGGGGGGGPLNFLVKGFQKGFEIIKSIVTGAWNIISTIFMTAINGIKTAFFAVWNTFGPLISAVFGLIKAIIILGWTIIKGLFLVALMGLLMITRTVWNGIKAVIGAAWAGIKAIVVPAVNFIKGIISAAWAAIRAVTAPVWNAIKAIISAVMGAVSSFVSDRVNTVKNNVKRAWDAIKAATSAVWEALRRVVFDKIAAVVQIAGTIGSKVLGAIGDFGSLLYNKGAELIQGLINGITSKIGAIKDAVGNVTGAIKGFLPGSPIKEGPLKSWNRGGAGKRLMDILTEGIVKGSPGPISAMERMVGTLSKDMNVTGSLRKGVSAYGTAIPKMLAPALSPQALAAMNPNARAGMASLEAGVLKTKVKKKNSGPKESRIVNGTLDIGPDGRVYIEGIARDVYDEEEDFNNKKGR